MIFSITHEYMSIRGHRHTFQTLKFAFAAAPTSERAQKRAVRMENLYAIVAGIGNADITLIIDGHTTWKLKLPILRTFTAKRRNHFTIDVEDLNSMVVRVGHNDPIRTGYGYVMRVFQLARFAAHRPKFTNKCTIRLENLYNDHYVFRISNQFYDCYIITCTL